MTLTPEQLKEHNEGLGGSDALAYAGKDPNKTPLELWREKTESPTEQKENPRMRWGQRLEPLIREDMANELGAAILIPPTARHPIYPFLVAHMDGVVGDYGVEIKTGDKNLAAEYGEVGTDAVPIRHVAQVMHYMMVTGIRRFHVGVLLGGNDDRRYVVDYDEALASILLEKALKFWNYVKLRVPPPPVSLDDCAYRWPASAERVLKASDTILEKYHELDVLRRQERKAARQADELEVEIKAYMGNVAILTNGTSPYPIATWRSQTREYVDVKSLTRDHPDLVAQYRTVSSHRVFRLK